MVRVSKSPADTIQPADVLTRRARQSPPSHLPRQHFNVMLRAPIAASTSTGPDAVVGIMETIASNAIDATRPGRPTTFHQAPRPRVSHSRRARARLQCTHHCAHRGPHYRHARSAPAQHTVDPSRELAMHALSHHGQQLPHGRYTATRDGSLYLRPRLLGTL